jgi:hypothetical protein
MDAKKERPEPKTIVEYMAAMKSIKGLLDEMRLSLIYLRFDVEATRRERDYFKKKAGRYGKGEA